MGEAYLDKFIDFSIKLPNPYLKNHDYLYLNLIVTTMKNLGIKDKTINELKNEILVYCSVFNVSIRQIIKLLNLFSIIKFDDLYINLNRLLIYKLFSFQQFNHSDLILAICYVFYNYQVNSIKFTNINQISNFYQQYESFLNDPTDYDINFDHERLMQSSTTFQTSKIANEPLKEFILIKINDTEELNSYHKGDLCLGVHDLHNKSSKRSSLDHKLSKYSPYPSQNVSWENLNSVWDEYIHIVINE